VNTLLSRMAYIMMHRNVKYISRYVGEDPFLSVKLRKI
jgi:hypothetical protein